MLWSGIRESNSFSQFGRLEHNQYAKSALVAVMDSTRNSAACEPRIGYCRPCSFQLNSFRSMRQGFFPTCTPRVVAAHMQMHVAGNTDNAYRDRATVKPASLDGALATTVNPASFDGLLATTVKLAAPGVRTPPPQPCRCTPPVLVSFE